MLPPPGHSHLWKAEQRLAPFDDDAPKKAWEEIVLALEDRGTRCLPKIERSVNMKVEPLQDVILTLQYCLETFEQTCQCGRCDPCTRGRRDITRSIRTIESLQFQQRKLTPRDAFLNP